MIKVQNICKTYYQAGQPVPVLNNVSFYLDSSKTLAVTGPSGSGKTTLLSLLAGLESPDQGEIFFKDQKISSMNELEKIKFRRQNTGIIFQQFHLMPHLTVLENVCLPLEIAGLGTADNIKTRACAELEKVKLSHRLNYLPSRLSGGEQQRTAIARACVVRPLLLLADEPSGNLDKTSAKEVIDILFSIVKENKASLVLVTHNLSLAKLCDHQIDLC